MDVERDAEVCVANKSAPLACRLVSPPHLAAYRLPLLACIKGLPFSGDAAKPARIELSKAVPHGVI